MSFWIVTGIPINSCDQLSSCPLQDTSLPAWPYSMSRRKLEGLQQARFDSTQIARSTDLIHACGTIRSRATKRG